MLPEEKIGNESVIRVTDTQITLHFFDLEENCDE